MYSYWFFGVISVLIPCVKTIVKTVCRLVCLSTTKLNKSLASAKTIVFSTGFTKVMRPLIHNMVLCFSLVKQGLYTVSTTLISTKTTLYLYFNNNWQNILITEKGIR